MSEADRLFERFGREYSPGTVLYREGETGETMFVVHSGVVALSKRGAAGPRTLAKLGAGEFFGELAILNDRPRTATAVVQEAAKILVLDAQTFGSMIMGSREIAVRMIQKFASRLAAADALVEILLHRDPKARVILALKRQAELCGARPDGSVLVPHSPKSLAEEVNLKESEVSSVIERLARVNVVGIAPTGFLIPDIMRLHEFLEFVQSEND